MVALRECQRAVGLRRGEGGSELTVVLHLIFLFLFCLLNFELPVIKFERYF